MNGKLLRQPIGKTKQHVPIDFFFQLAANAEASHLVQQSFAHSTHREHAHTGSKGNIHSQHEIKVCLEGSGESKHLYHQSNHSVTSSQWIQQTGNKQTSQLYPGWQVGHAKQQKVIGTVRW